jgi:hypothetical protein
VDTQLTLERSRELVRVLGRPCDRAFLLQALPAALLALSARTESNAFAQPLQDIQRRERERQERLRRANAGAAAAAAAATPAAGGAGGGLFGSDEEEEELDAEGEREGDGLGSSRGSVLGRRAAGLYVQGTHRRSRSRSQSRSTGTDR